MMVDALLRTIGEGDVTAGLSGGDLQSFTALSVHLVHLVLLRLHHHRRRRRRRHNASGRQLLLVRGVMDSVSRIWGLDDDLILLLYRHTHTHTGRC